MSGAAVLKKKPPSSKASIAGDVADGEIETIPLGTITPSITAIAGESGSGKTTFARVIAGILDKSSGSLRYKDKDIDQMNSEDILSFKKEVQTIFQDPFEVYNPFYKVDHVLTTPIKKFGLAAGSVFLSQNFIFDLNLTSKIARFAGDLTKFEILEKTRKKFSDF